MKTTLLKPELTEQEAKDMIVITEKECAVIRSLVSGINAQVNALDHALNSIGVESYVSLSHPRTLANYKFTIKEE
tara:strand:+ start:167 stop:391 length:225 start_codon:yes stop_codon:yes gene_type:complete